jgi:L-asparagine transporter-like permease
LKFLYFSSIYKKIFLIAGLMVYITFSALAEMKINDPETGSFRDYARKAFGEIESFSTFNWFPKGIKGLWSAMIFAPYRMNI